MAARKVIQGLSAGLSTHPMLHKLVEAHLSGQSTRKIASWLRPSVAHTTISRYIVQHIDPVMGNAEALKNLLRANKDENKPLPAALQGVAGVAPTQQSVDEMAVRAIVGAPVLAIRENRIAAQQDRHRRLQMIVEGRAKEMKDEVAGGESGFIARDYKGSGDALKPIYRFDAPLATAFLEHEKAIAIELGQWQENAGGSNVSIQIVCPAAPEGAAPRISYASEDAIDICESIGLLQKP